MNLLPSGYLNAVVFGLSSEVSWWIFDFGTPLSLLNIFLLGVSVSIFVFG